MIETSIITFRGDINGVNKGIMTRMIRPSGHSGVIDFVKYGIHTFATSNWCAIMNE